MIDVAYGRVEHVRPGELLTAVEHETLEALLAAAEPTAVSVARVLGVHEHTVRYRLTIIRVKRGWPEEASPAATALLALRERLAALRPAPGRSLGEGYGA